MIPGYHDTSERIAKQHEYLKRLLDDINQSIHELENRAYDPLLPRGDFNAVLRRYREVKGDRLKALRDFEEKYAKELSPIYKALGDIWYDFIFATFPVSNLTPAIETPYTTARYPLPTLTASIIDSGDIPASYAPEYGEVQLKRYSPDGVNKMSFAYAAEVDMLFWQK